MNAAVTIRQGAYRRSHRTFPQCPLHRTPPSGFDGTALKERLPSCVRMMEKSCRKPELAGVVRECLTEGVKTKIVRNMVGQPAVFDLQLRHIEIGDPVVGGPAVHVRTHAGHALRTRMSDIHSPRNAGTSLQLVSALNRF